MADKLALWRIAHPGVQVGWMGVGLVLVVGFVAVAWLVQRETGASSRPLIALTLVSVAAVAAAAIVGSVHRAIVPFALALSVSYVAYRWRSDLDAGPLSGPFGYRNAFGALLLQGAFAWLIAGFSFAHPVVRVISAIPALILAVLAGGTSVAAAASSALVLLALLAFAGRNGARVAVALAGVAFALMLAGTIWLGATYEPGRPVTGIPARVADAGVTERRLALWHDAIVIAVGHPGGVGYKRFATESPTALGDRDALYAHNEFLEAAAELGFAGLALSLAIVTWAFARLAVVREADARTALAGVALGAIVIHACVDYVLHFPAILIAAAVLLGTGIGNESHPEMSA